ncbi:MAG: hypothetical protein ACRYF4_07145 [Janthinobacterium lividum]
MSLQKKETLVNTARVLSSACLGLISCSALSGCLVAGFSSSGGAFIWPGGLGLVFMLLVVLWFLLRRR